jgi:hypothetical protein
MGKKPRIGDRFKFIPSKDVWEVTEIYSKYQVKLICVESISKETPIATMSDPYPIDTLMKPDLFEFIGNFSKSSNFRDIYKILNEEVPNP